MKHRWEPFIDEEPPADSDPYDWIRRCEVCGTPMTSDNEDADCPATRSLQEMEDK